MPKPNTDPEQSTEQTDDSGNDIERLKSALTAERQAHKETRAKYLTPVREALGMGEDASIDAITAALQSRLGDADSIVQTRTAELQAEKDAATTELETLRAERNAERIETAIKAALAKSGMTPQHFADAANLIRGSLEVSADGKVVTKSADGVVAGQSVDQFILGQLRSQRGHYWPVSRGAGARAGSELGTIDADAACFDPRSPQYSITKQFVAEARRGKAWADQQIARFRGTK